MPWFYYSGNVSRTLPVKKGLSVAVAPHSKVEILDPNLREVQALRKKGVLRRTGRPAGAVSIQNIPTVSGEDVKAVTPKSAMAQRIAEKGVTRDPGQAPKKLKGQQPEMTEGELRVEDKERAEADVKADAEEAPPEDSTNGEFVDVLELEPDDAGDDDEILSGADQVEVLSDVDGSPDGNKGDKDHWSMKKKRRKK